jgi:membrane protein involved in colicin uptake
MDTNELIDRIRAARDHALEQEKEERTRIADAETVEKQNAASVRLATRQAVREALDDILGDSRDSGTLE